MTTESERLSQSERRTMTVLVLSVQGDKGMLWNGPLNFEMGEEPAAVAVLRELRARDVPVAEGDLLFFPDAAPRHRAVEIDAGNALARHHGWSI